MRGGGPLTRAGGLSGGNQQKVVVAREIARDPKVLIAAQPTRGLDVGAIEYLHRRLVEERDEGRAILLISLELEEVMSLSDRILVIYEGEIVGEHGAGRDRAGDRPRDARRAPQDGGGRMSGTAPTAGAARRRARAAADAAGRRARAPLAAKMWLGQRAGGVVVPLLTALVAFLIGGIVVAATGHNPLTTYRDIFNGAGLNWFFHPTTDTVDTAAYNLSQTLLQTTTLILTGLAVAFAFRCGMFNIGGQGQYFVGLVRRRSGSARRSRAWRRRRTSCSASSPRRSPGAIWAGIAGFLKATRRRPRGDHDDHAQLDRDLGRARTCSAPAARSRTPNHDAADLERRRRGGAGCPCSGATRTSRACTSASSSRSRRSSSSGCS